jgi:hypothetical protein
MSVKTMLWNQLLSQQEEVVLPWMGGQTIHSAQRRFNLSTLPPEHGWHRFQVDGSRRAQWVAADLAPFDMEQGAALVRGYCIGDRVLSDDVAVTADMQAAFAQSEKVWLMDPSLERFARVLAMRHRDGRLLYLRQEFPLGPEPYVQEAWQDRLPSVAQIPHVTPALDLAFRWLTRQREVADARREALERRERAEAEAQARRDAAKLLLHDAIRSGEARRRLKDFPAAARAALAVSGAELLDHRQALAKGEMIVQFRFQARRFECVVAEKSLQIIDAGICLVDHSTDERGDSYFTLESLPAVIHEAMRRGVLVVFRHAG